MSPKMKTLLTVGVGGVVVVFVASTALKQWGPATAARDYEILFKVMQDGARAPSYQACTDERQLRFSEVLAELESVGKTDLFVKGSQLLADCQMARKQYELAIRTYQGILQYEPQKGARHGELAKALSGAKRHNEAIRSAHLAVQLSPETWQAHRLKAQVLERAGRTSEALTTYQKALQFAPPDKLEGLQQSVDRLRTLLELQVMDSQSVL